MNISTIREKLRRGDYIIIASMTDYSVSAISKQFNGLRTIQETVLEAAIKVIQSREELMSSKQNSLTK